MAFISVNIIGHKEVEAAFTKYSVKVHTGVKDVINTTALNVQRKAKRLCPVDTGRLRSSIRPMFTDQGLSAKVYTDVEYAPDIEMGTAPHVIVPVRAKVLSWIPKAAGKALFTNSKGKQTIKKYYNARGGGYSLQSNRVFAKRVNHPGTKAQPFLFPAWESERPLFIAALTRILGRKP